MSLDLYIKGKTPVLHKGTGVFIRENGKNIELSPEEVKKKWPNAKVEEIEEYNNTWWHANITHNLGTMAKQVSVDGYTLYQLLWRPEETDLLSNDSPTERYVECVGKALKELKLHRAALIMYNPSNGWGTYRDLLDFTADFLDALKRILVLSDCTIEADR